MQARLKIMRSRATHHIPRMTYKHHILTILSFAFLCCVFAPNQAKAEDKGTQTGQKQNSRVAYYNKPVWGKNASHQTGLYTVKNKSVASGVCMNISAMYYYGDIDMLDQAFVHGFQPQNLSFGGGLHFGYLHPLGRFCNWRFTVGAGYMHGNDSSRYDIKDDIKIPAGKGWFKSIFGEANAGVEFYPFPRAGFYIYAGLGLAVSYIEYDFFKSRLPEPKDGTTISVLPMLPLEIGYNFYLGGSVFLGVYASVHQGLLDMGHANLDAWPLETTHVFQWGDGYFQLGISFSYRWHNCEACRLVK